MCSLMRVIDPFVFKRISFKSYTTYYVNILPITKLNIFGHIIDKTTSVAYWILYEQKRVNKIIQQTKLHTSMTQWTKHIWRLFTACEVSVRTPIFPYHLCEKNAQNMLTYKKAKVVLVLFHSYNCHWSSNWQKNSKRNNDQLQYNKYICTLEYHSTLFKVYTNK